VFAPQHPNAPRGGIARDVLAANVAEGKSIREIAVTLDRSPATVRHWLRVYGLRTLRRARVVPEDRQRPVLRIVCPRHGPTDHVLCRDGSHRCKRCRAESVSRRRRRLKAQLVAEAGGRCVRCGYDTCEAALHFHHLDPSTKRFSLATAGVTYSLARARAEVVKCALLCANCHSEIEAGVATLPPGRPAEGLPGPG